MNSIKVAFQFNTYERNIQQAFQLVEDENLILSHVGRYAYDGVQL